MAEVRAIPKRNIAAEAEHQPPKKIYKNVKGQIRKYHYLKTMKSMEDLDKFRFMVINEK
jgi:hypothetical protein